MSPPSPMPSQRPDVGEGRDRGRRSGVRLAEHGVDAGSAGVGGVAGERQQHAFADLGLPAADRAAPAGSPVRVDREMADLPCEAGDASQQAPVDDHAAAHADLARHVQDVVHADGRAAPRLAEDARVGVVHDGDRDGGRERAGEARAERNVDPAEVGGHRHQAVAAPHDAGHGHADADDRAVVAHGQVADQGREISDHVVHRQLDPGPLDADPLEGLAAEADDRDRDRVDEDLEAENGGAVRVQPDERRGPAGRAEGDGALLDDEAGGAELADERADRAAGEAGRGDELGTGKGAVLVEAADDCAEVGPVDRFAALSDVDAADSQGL